VNNERTFNPVWLVALITLLVLGLLVVFFWDFVSANVILPIYSFLILAVYGINSVSQGIYLFLLVLLAIALAIIFLGLAFSKAQAPKYYTSSHYSVDIVSRYAFWRTQCDNLNRNHFANEEFARSARKMLLDVLAYQEHRDIFELEMMVMREELELPPEVQHLIAQRKLTTRVKPKNWIQLQWRRIQRIFNHDSHAPTTDVLNEVEVIITFLEQRMEIYHND
jgi:hypothetical protein